MIFFLNKSFRQLMCQECLWVLSNILIVQNQRLTIILYFAWGKTDSELKNKWIWEQNIFSHGIFILSWQKFLNDG